MINLKTEEFVLEMTTLQSLQQLIQWVGDFVLYLLASLPNQGSPVRPGHSFLRDGASLGMFRELMVVIRIWGLLKPSCLPVYTATSDTQDSMSLLFRLLTKLWLCCREENHITEPDDALIDECCLLPSQLLIPNIDWLPINDGIISKLQNKQLVRLQFGKAPGLVGHTVSSQFDAFVRYKPPGTSQCRGEKEAWQLCAWLISVLLGPKSSLSSLFESVSWLVMGWEF